MMNNDDDPPCEVLSCREGADMKIRTEEDIVFRMCEKHKTENFGGEDGGLAAVERL